METLHQIQSSRGNLLHYKAKYVHIVCLIWLSLTIVPVFAWKMPPSLFRPAKPILSKIKFPSESLHAIRTKELYDLQLKFSEPVLGIF